MPWTQAESVVVVIANQFNPTVLSQSWLERNDVLAKDDLLQGSIFTDVLVQVRSSQFHMLAVPPQLQFVPAVPPDRQQAVIRDRLGKLISLIPHTPYKGLGLNFLWRLAPADGDIGTLSRSLFAVHDRPLYQNFGGADAHFGAYMSKDFSGFRLKLDIKPALIEEAGSIQHLLLFAFNYHFDLGENAATQIAERLSHWDAVRQETERIIDSVERR
jgi:hypothetical protein